MSRINVIEIETAEGRAKDLLEGVRSKLGFTPNFLKSMANSPTVLKSYLNLSGSLGTVLNAKLREQIALFTAESNGCAYCASAHTAIGKTVGLSHDDTVAARRGSAADRKHDAALLFAKRVMNNRGRVSDQEIQAVRDAGFSDGEITEIVAHVTLSVFTNYFNEVARPEIDFPKVELFLQSAGA